jgi:hypothetical protein
METEISYFDEKLNREVSGRFVINRGTITVHSAYGSKSAQIGGHASAPRALAQMLLRELAHANFRDLGSV